MGTGIISVIADYGILQQMIVFPDFTPHTEHKRYLTFLCRKQQGFCC